MDKSEFWGGALLVVFLVIIAVAIVSYNAVEKNTEECNNAGYVDHVTDLTVLYCYRVEGNDLIGRSLEAIRVEARGQ